MLINPFDIGNCSTEMHISAHLFCDFVLISHDFVFQNLSNDRDVAPSAHNPLVVNLLVVSQFHADLLFSVIVLELLYKLDQIIVVLSAAWSACGRVSKNMFP